MGLNDSYVKNLHQAFTGGPFDSLQVKSQNSSIAIPQEGALFFEKNSYHLGVLRRTHHTIELVLINPGMQKKVINKITGQGKGEKALVEWLGSKQKPIVPGLTSLTLPVDLDCTDFHDGFYQVALVFRASSDMPLKVEIHWAISSRGKVRHISSAEQTNRVVQIAFTGKTFTPQAIRLGAFYSKSGNHYICESLEAGRVYLKAYNKPEHLLMSLMTSGAFHYFLRAGERLKYFFFHDQSNLQINSMANRKIYYDKKLQHYQREKSLFDHFVLIINKSKKVVFKPTSLPSWLSVVECKNKVKTTQIEFKFEPQSIKFGKNKGEIKLKAKTRSFSLPVSCQLLPSSLEPLSIPNEVDLTQAQITEDDVLEGHIPVKVIGVGKLSVSIGEAAISHPGFFEDYSQEQLRIVNYPIRIALNRLSIDKVSNLTLKVYLDSYFDDKKLFKTTLLLRKKTWKRTIHDVIGYLHIYHGQDTKYEFEYQFHDGELISEFSIDIPRDLDDEKFFIEFTSPQYRVYRIEGDKQFPFLFITHLNNNQFCIEVLTTHVCNSFAFDVPLTFELKTDRRNLRDRIDVVGKILIADLDIQHLPDTHQEKVFYRHGTLRLSNPSKHELCIYSYTSQNSDVRLEGKESFLNFPIILQPDERVRIRYSFLNGNNRIPTITFHYNNPHKQVVHLSDEE